QPSAKPADLELIRLILPDAVEDDAGNTTARKTITLRDLFDNSAPGDYEGRIKLDSFLTLPTQNGARQDLFLLLKLTSEDDLFTWGELNVLALVRRAPRPRLLDAAEIQADRFAELWSEHNTLAIGPRQEALVIANSHFNSSQGYL